MWNTGDWVALKITNPLMRQISIQSIENNGVNETGSATDIRRRSGVPLQSRGGPAIIM